MPYSNRFVMAAAGLWFLSTAVSPGQSPAPAVAKPAPPLVEEPGVTGPATAPGANTRPDRDTPEMVAAALKDIPDSTEDKGCIHMPLTSSYCPRIPASPSLLAENRSAQI
jgi:hypothetical protein